VMGHPDEPVNRAVSDLRTKGFDPATISSEEKCTRERREQLLESVRDDIS
jgi:hypothetical protein